MILCTKNMPEYLHPGVYMEEFAVPKSIEGVSTNTAGFIGQTQRGPLKPRLVTNFIDFQRLYGGFIEESYLAYAVDGFFKNGGKKCYIKRIAEQTPPGKIDIHDKEGNISLGIDAIGPGKWGKDVFVNIKDATYDGDFFKLEIYFPTINDTSNIEVFDGLSSDPDSERFFEKIVNGTSNFVLIKNVNSKRPNNIETNLIENSEEGIWDPKISDYQAYEDALDELKEIKDISIICVPDELGDYTLQDKIKIHCKECNAFAIFQTEKDAFKNISTLKPKHDTMYAAVYFPWIEILDPLTNQPKLIPPGGHVAGIYARTDTERGVHKAPANETVRGIRSLQVKIGSEQDFLNPRGINVIRDFPDKGIVVYGARTMSSNPNWRYINVRRLLSFIGKSIEKGTQWAVFEPNNEKLWARVNLTISAFLHGVWKTGALMGTSLEEAFFVKCDKTTMTQDDIDSGRLVCIIGVAPTKPAEFVIFQISMTKEGSKIEES